MDHLGSFHFLALKAILLAVTLLLVPALAHVQTATGQDEVLCAIPMVAPYCSLGGQVNQKDDMMTGKAQVSPIRYIYIVALLIYCIVFKSKNGMNMDPTCLNPIFHHHFISQF